MNFAKHELLLIRRALILLSCVLDGREAKTCARLSEHFASEYRVKEMLEEDEPPNPEDE